MSPEYKSIRYTNQMYLLLTKTERASEDPDMDPTRTDLTHKKDQNKGLQSVNKDLD